MDIEKLERCLEKNFEIERKKLDFLLQDAFPQQHDIVKSVNTILHIIIVANVVSFYHLFKESFFNLLKTGSCIDYWLWLILILLILASFICASIGAFLSMKFMLLNKASYRHIPNNENLAPILKEAKTNQKTFYAESLVRLIENQRKTLKENEESIEERQKPIGQMKLYASFATGLLILFLFLSCCTILWKT